MNHLLFSFILLFFASLIPMTEGASAAEKKAELSLAKSVCQEAAQLSDSPCDSSNSPQDALNKMNTQLDTLNQMVQFQQKWIDSIITTGLTVGGLFVSIFGIVIPFYIQGKNSQKLEETVQQLNNSINKARATSRKQYNNYKISIDQQRAQIDILLNIARTSDIHKKIELYNQLLNIDTNRFQLYVERANLQMDRSRISDHGAFEQAIADYDSALLLVKAEVNKEGEEFVYLSKAKAMAKFSKYSEAIDLYNKAIDINPKSAEAQLCLGHVYYNKVDYEQAMKCYTKASESADGDYFIKALSSAYLASDQKDYENALKWFSEALTIDPESSDAYNGRGQVYLKLAQSNLKPSSLATHSAEANQLEINNSDMIQLSYIDLTKALSIDPLYAAPSVNLGRLCALQGDAASAFAWYERALRLNKDFPIVYYNRARLQHRLKNYKEAIFDYTKAIEMNPAHAKALAYRCECHCQINDAKSAFVDYCALENSQPELIECLLSEDVINFCKRVASTIDSKTS